MKSAATDLIGRITGRPGAVSFSRFARIVRDAGKLAEEMRGLSDEALVARATLTLPDGRKLPRTETTQFLATIREAATRALGLRPFDQQLLACCALLSGHAIEMDTGEGKTLVGALAAAGFGLAGRNVQIISVNDYLAERDAAWMGPLFSFVGLSVGWIGQQTTHDQRKRTYRQSIVYAPVSEVGFDVLRDRFVFDSGQRVDPQFDVAIVDEADAVMVDEAMVPLVLAGVSSEVPADFGAVTTLVESLVEGADFLVDGDRATATLTDAGLDNIEARLGDINLYDAQNTPMLTQINLALHAQTLVHRDVDYLVEDGSVRLIASSRGRVAHLQRWPDGLQAAIEAKERLAASEAGVILDSVTIQDLLGQYRTLSGMSGTMVAVAEELMEFYEVPVGRIERHKPNRRVGELDHVSLDGSARLAAAVAEISARHATGQPVLVGTQSVAESEALAAQLRGLVAEVRVLNAKNDANEAAIIARAGEVGAVTVSTQMSGRGTDIRLGGTDERFREKVVASGGLAVIGVGRYPSRRLDGQLRGRAARQGDPGTTRTFVSLDDELVVTNASAHDLVLVDNHGGSLGMAQRREIVDTAQRISEGTRRDRHRATWEYSRAIANQRAVVLAHRRQVLDGNAAEERLRQMIPKDMEVLEAQAGASALASVVRARALLSLDSRWSEHLEMLQEVRDGIHLRSLGGQVPVREFQEIAAREFRGFFDSVYQTVAETIEEDLLDGGVGIVRRRPSATWTYMMIDDPFGSADERFTRGAAQMWRSKVRRIE